MNKPAWLIKVGAKLTEKRPDILVGTGIALMAGAAVLGCVQTAKYMNDVLDEHNEKIENIKKNVSEEDQKAEIRTRYFNTSLSIVKMYAAPVAMISIGATFICLGHGEMKKRYTVMAAAYNTVSKAYDVYRKRISEKYGEDADYYGRYGVETVTEKDENGEEVKKRVLPSEDMLADASPYLRVIDQDSIIFKECGGSPIHIRAALEQYEQMLNSMYYNGQPIYYNDVIRWIFGAKDEYLSDDGQIVGWYLRDPINTENADGYKPVNLRISTFLGKKGDDDAYDQDMVYICIDPNVAGVVSLARGAENKIRKGGRYIGQV